MRSVLFAVAFFFMTGLLPAVAAEFQLMTKEELKPKLGASEVIVIDARGQAQWETSQSKIPGAVRIADEGVAAWADNVSKDKTLVIYCA